MYISNIENVYCASVKYVHLCMCIKKIIYSIRPWLVLHFFLSNIFLLIVEKLNPCFTLLCIFKNIIS